MLWISAEIKLHFIDEKPKRPMWKTALVLFCGLEEKGSAPELTPEEKEAMMAAMTDITEHPTTKLLVDCGGILMLSVAVFLFAFYA